MLADTPPVVTLVLPQEKKIRLKPTDQLPVGWMMTDDVGLAGAEFTVETDARQHATVPITLPAARCRQDPARGPGQSDAGT